jgi:acylphosphatase
MRKRMHILYSGRVQGVGFRFTAESMAIQSGIQGWVKNLGDGRVEIVAEAEEAALKDFLNKIRQSFSRYIQEEDLRWSEAVDEFHDFQIRF